MVDISPLGWPSHRNHTQAYDCAAKQPQQADRIMKDGEAIHIAKNHLDIADLLEHLWLGQSLLQAAQSSYFLTLKEDVDVTPQSFML